LAFAAGHVTIDTETTGLDAMIVDLVGVSLCVEPGRACYIPLAHKGPEVQGGFDFGDGGEAGPSDAPEQVDLDKAIAMQKEAVSALGSEEDQSLVDALAFYEKCKRLISGAS